MGEDVDAGKSGDATHHANEHALFFVLKEEVLEAATADKVIICARGDFESGMVHGGALSVLPPESSHNSPRLATTNNLECSQIVEIGVEEGGGKE